MFICEIWLFDWYFPQLCKSGMSKYGYLEVFQSVPSTSRKRESIVYYFSSVAGVVAVGGVYSDFSSPEPKAPGKITGWEASVGRPSAVRPHFQTTSSLKPLGQM